MSEVRILIVEDEAIVARDLHATLEKLGYLVPPIIMTGEEAIEKAAELGPDLVLMDIVLKGEMDGITAAQRIRDELDIPVVYLTAYADDATLERAKVTEPFGYLIKPFEERELQTNIEMALYKHRMETKLKASERWLSTTLRSIGDGVIATDADAKVVFMNPVAEELTGRKEEEALGKPLREVFRIVNEHTRAPAESPVEKAIRQGVLVGLANHTVLIARDGSETPISDSAAPIREDGGDVTGVVMVFRDITERRAWERKLAAEKERLAVTLRSIGDGVVVTDTEGKVVMLNRVAETLTGWKDEEAAGEPLSEVFRIIDEKTREPCDNPVEKVLEAGLVVGLANHTVLIARDGIERNIEDSGAPIHDKDSNIHGVVLVFRDVTDKLRLEDEVRKMQKLESVGILAGGIAHDFNNILTAVLGNIGLAKLASEPGGEVFEKLKEAEKAGGRASELTQQLLTFSRGGAPVKRTASVIRLLQDSASLSLSGSASAYEIYIDEDLWAVDIDEGQMSQVLNNLIINASQAMPDGGLLEVHAENEIVGPGHQAGLQQGRYVCMAVKDRGVGISEEHIGKVFDPYFTTKQKGSGLGLAVSYSIVKRHDGQITVESELGAGTTFRVYLPASTGKLPPEVRAEEKPIPGEGKILVMDDDEQIRHMVGHLLAGVGYEAEFATDGAEAIELYRKSLAAGKPFDAVVLDLTVPGGMGGREALSALREMDPSVKAVVSSGYSNDPVLADHARYGFRAALVKPYKVGELSQVLHDILN